MLDDHRGKVALLISDVDGLIPPDVLERICAQWVLRSPYMPKAFDLHEAAKKDQERDRSDDYKRRCELAEMWNAQLHQQGNDKVRWIAEPSGGLKLKPVPQPEAPPPKLSFDELQNLATMGALGKSILDLGIACGDLTQADVDSLYQRTAA